MERRQEMVLNDRRKYPRYETGVELSIFTQDEKIPARMFDIGEGGIGVNSPQAIEPETKVYVTLADVEDYALRGVVKGTFALGNGPDLTHRLNIKAESIIWTDFKAVGFPDRSEFVARVLSRTEKKVGVYLDLL